MEDVILTCSKCGKELVHIIYNKEYTHICNKIVAHCCFCNDKSFEQEINGVIYMQQIGDIEMVNNNIATTLKDGKLYQNIEIITRKVKND